MFIILFWIFSPAVRSSAGVYVPNSTMTSPDYWIPTHDGTDSNGNGPATGDTDENGTPDWLDQFFFASESHTIIWWTGVSPLTPYRVDGAEWTAPAQWIARVDSDGDGIPDDVDPHPDDARNNSYYWPGAEITLPNGSIYLTRAQWFPGHGEAGNFNGVPACVEATLTDGNYFSWPGGTFLLNGSDCFFYGRYLYGVGVTDTDGDGIPDVIDPAVGDPSNGTTFYWAGGDYLINGAIQPFAAGNYPGFNPGDRDHDGIPDNIDPYPDDFSNNTAWWAGGSAPFEGHLSTFAGACLSATSGDRDGDGIPDQLDKYPDDPTNNSAWWPGGPYTINGVENVLPGQWIPIGDPDTDLDGIPDSVDPYYSDRLNNTPGFTWPPRASDGSPTTLYFPVGADNHMQPFTSTDYYLVTWADTDGDGIPDIADPYPEDPCNGNDTDGDGIPDFVEDYYGLNRLNPSDASYLHAVYFQGTGWQMDVITWKQAYDHRAVGWLDHLADTNLDSDLDGMSDVYEIVNGLNPLDPNDALDAPISNLDPATTTPKMNDFILNYERARAGLPLSFIVTNPAQYHTITGRDAFLLPLHDFAMSVAENDWDGDHVSNRDEILRFATDIGSSASCPSDAALVDAYFADQAAGMSTSITTNIYFNGLFANADSDGDGIRDADEVFFGLNRKDSADAGNLRTIKGESDGLSWLEAYQQNYLYSLKPCGCGGTACACAHAGCCTSPCNGGGGGDGGDGGSGGTIHDCSCGGALCACSPGKTNACAGNTGPCFKCSCDGARDKCGCSDSTGCAGGNVPKCKSCECGGMNCICANAAVCGNDKTECECSCGGRNCDCATKDACGGDKTECECSCGGNACACATKDACEEDRSVCNPPPCSCGGGADCSCESEKACDDPESEATCKPPSVDIGISGGSGSGSGGGTTIQPNSNNDEHRPGNAQDNDNETMLPIDPVTKRSRDPDIVQFTISFDKAKTTGGTLKLHVPLGYRVFDDQGAVLATTTTGETSITLDKNKDSITINAEGLDNASNGDFTVEFDGYSGGGGGGHIEDKTKLAAMEMIPDSNHDGTIDESDRGKVSEEKPWSFWLNDNDDEHENPLGPQHANCNNGHVDGAKDLKDFFPVFLNIQQTVKAFPPKASPANQAVKYKLKQADGAVNIVETNLTREAAFSYSDSTGTGYGALLQQHAPNAETTRITAAGVELSSRFLDNIKDHNKGVILIEGRAPTDKPLVLTVEEGGVQVAEVSLPLSLAPRILLLLHGMNSNTDTWEEFVNAAFPYDASVGTNAVRSMVIRNKDFVPDLPATLPHFNRVPGSFGNRGVRCYRLQFGAPEKPSTTRTGLPGDNGIPLTTGTAKGGIDGQLIPYLSDRRVKCGDFETFDELAQEVDAAITMLLDRHPGAKIVLVGHSRGGLAGRKFLEGSSTNKDAVVGFLTTSSLHKGSQMGRIYQWLSDNPRHVFNGAGQELMEQITLTAGTQTVTYYEPVNWRDWAVVDFLCAASWPFSSYKTKDTLDVRRPVIMDMDDRSTAIATLNDPTQVANLPPKVMYGEVVYAKVDLGVLVSNPPYSAFSNSQILTSLCPTVSVAAKTYILGAGKLPDDFPGDGLIRWENQYFTKLSGFPAPGYPPAPPPATDQNTILRKYVTDRSVVHTEAPLQVDDLRAQLRLIVPSWFP